MERSRFAEEQIRPLGSGVERTMVFAPRKTGVLNVTGLGSLIRIGIDPVMQACNRRLCDFDHRRAGGCSP